MQYKIEYPFIIKSENKLIRIENNHFYSYIIFTKENFIKSFTTSLVSISGSFFYLLNKIK